MCPNLKTKASNARCKGIKKDQSIAKVILPGRWVVAGADVVAADDGDARAGDWEVIGPKTEINIQTMGLRLGQIINFKCVSLKGSIFILEHIGSEENKDGKCIPECPLKSDSTLLGWVENWSRSWGRPVPLEAAVEPDPPVLVPGGPLFQTLPAEGGGVGTEEIPPSAGLTNKKYFYHSHGTRAAAS